jgi:lysophospholipase L1-like esterase
MGAVTVPSFLTHCSNGEPPLPEKPVIQAKPKQNCCFVFQGDSVTEAGRRDGLELGTGYVFHISSRLMADFPQSDFVIYNRGKGGDMLGDILWRWDSDTLALKPDVLSILIGINHTIAGAEDLGAPVSGFENGYRQMLDITLEKFPDTVFILGLPFIMPVGSHKDDWKRISEDISKRIDIIKRLANEYNAVCIDYPALFEKVNDIKPYEYWVADGVHPTIAGHELMAREWMKAASDRLPYLKKHCECI